MIFQLTSIIGNHWQWKLTGFSSRRQHAATLEVEKSCRLLKHSMRCVPDLFKPNLSDVARTLVTAFQQHQHSSSPGKKHV
jgi:hypothetical protein